MVLYNNRYLKLLICFLLIISISISFSFNAFADGVALPLIYAAGGPALVAFAVAVLAVGLTFKAVDDLKDFYELIHSNYGEYPDPDYNPNSNKGLKALLSSLALSGSSMLINYGSWVSDKVKVSEVVAPSPEYPRGFLVEQGHFYHPATSNDKSYNLNSPYLSKLTRFRVFNNTYDSAFPRWTVVFYPKDDFSYYTDVSLSEFFESVRPISSRYNGVDIMYKLYKYTSENRHRYTCLFDFRTAGRYFEGESIQFTLPVVALNDSDINYTKREGSYIKKIDTSETSSFDKPSLAPILNRLSSVEKVISDEGRVQYHTTTSPSDITDIFSQNVTVENLKPTNDNYTIFEKGDKTIIEYETDPNYSIENLPGPTSKPGENPSPSGDPGTNPNPGENPNPDPGGGENPNPGKSYDDTNLLEKLTQVFVKPDPIDLDFTPLMNIPISEKFPFSLPWDLKRSVEILIKPPLPVKFVVPMVTEEIQIDFSAFNKWAVITRTFLSIIFVVGMIILTRRFIGGA